MLKPYRLFDAKVPRYGWWDVIRSSRHSCHGMWQVPRKYGGCSANVEGLHYQSPVTVLMHIFKITDKYWKKFWINFQVDTKTYPSGVPLIRPIDT